MFGVVVEAGIDLVEMRDNVADFGELADIDLAATDQIEDDVAELGEGVGTAAIGQGGVEPRAALPRASFESIS
jgi:hypothetical protein